MKYKTIINNATAIEIITMLYIILFLYTGISKLLEYNVFEEQIATSPVLSPIANLIAVGLPSIEFFAVLLLTIPKWRLKGFYLSLSLMTLFTFYIISILTFSDEIPCSCGGILAQMSWSEHLAFNSIFIAMAAIAIILQKRTMKANQQQRTFSVNSI